MSHQVTLADQILQTVRCTPECTLEEFLEDLVQRNPDLSWAQIFLEIDRLSRSGQLRLTARGVGSYTIKLGAMAGS